MQRSSYCIGGVPGVEDFDELPPSEATMIIYGGDPEVLHRQNFRSLLFAPQAGAFHNQVQRVFRPVAVVDADNEVRPVIFLLTEKGVRYGEPKMVILDVADHLIHVFKSLCEFLLP